MIKGMPQYAQGPIQNYLDTGNFKNHNKELIPQEADPKGAIAEFRSNVDQFIAMDNVEGVDLDPRVGRLKVEDFFTISGGYEKSDGVTEMFQLLGTEQEGAVIYSRDNGEQMDLVTVSNAPGAEEGVQHYDGVNPEKSFMTFPPQG